MGSSAQNSSGVHWCRCRVRFNELPEKVPQVPGAETGQVQQGSGKGSWRRFQGSLGAKPSQVQQGSGEGSGEGWGEGSGEGHRVSKKVLEKGSGEGSREGYPKGRGGFGAEPPQVQQGSGEGSGEGCGARSGRLWCRARSSSTRLRRRFPAKVWEAFVQSQVRFNRVPEKVLEKVWEALVQSQVRFNSVPEKVPRRSGKLWCRARSGSEQVWEALVERQVRFNRVPEKVAEKVPGSLGAKPSQVQRCQVLEKAGRLGCRAVSEKVPEKVWEGLVQRQVRFNRVPEKEVSEKVPGGFVQRQVRFKGSGEGLGGFGGG